MKRSEFVLDYVRFLYYKCHKRSPYCGGSYIDSPNWRKKKTVTKNPINKRYFQYAVTVALIYEEIKKIHKE